MKAKGTITLSLVFFLGCTSAAFAVDADHQLSIKQLQKEWLELYKLPSDGKRSFEMQKLRSALERAYRAQNKDLQANFIESSLESELANSITQIDKGALADFPAVERKNRYIAGMQKSGTITFSPITGCTGHFSIPVTSKHYAEALKHVGSLKAGAVKAVPEVPFRELLTDKELVLMPDNPDTAQ